MTQHSEEQSDLASGLADPVLPVVNDQVNNERKKFLGDLEIGWKVYIGAAITMAVISVASDLTFKGYVNLEKMLTRAMAAISIAIPFFLKHRQVEEELTPEPFTSKASELPRLLKKAIQVKHLSADFEEANLGVWRALSYLSKKLDPEHKTAITEEALGDLKGFLASETRRDRLETLVRIAGIAADPELLPLLRDLKDRTKDLDVLDNLRVALRDAISSCAKFA